LIDETQSKNDTLIKEASILKAKAEAELAAAKAEQEVIAIERERWQFQNLQQENQVRKYKRLINIY
jgi:hypothetical protein